MMEYRVIDADDEALIAAARDVISRNYVEERHSVGAAVRCASGTIYTGVNIETCGFGPCAEPIALGAAISHGEREFVAIVAVSGWQADQPLLPPCGNCRQMLLDYAPEAMVILEHNGKLVKASVKSLIPNAYRLFQTGYP
jgi:cytidine deaminase